ncbi:320_t:CDS:2 [Entrophospora sp. SA101]|nr:320_t:CDS:2 [Entrophospora sp. SA101]
MSKDSIDNHNSDNVNITQNGIFEGPEKLLELWFYPISPNIEKNHNNENGTSKLGLRTVPKEVWDEVLEIVKCHIISVIENEYIDAYLLSESSLFIYPHKLILKTCGTTMLLSALPKLLETALKYCNFHKVWRVFYSRKSFMFPELQSHPHNSWNDEVKFLDKFFETKDSKPMIDISDQTIEILMTELNEESMKIFHHKMTGLDNLYPSAKLDSYLFEPCGYSSNGLLDDSYFNVHVTPEPICSYASFETNIPLTNSSFAVELIENVISIFKPRKFTMTIFATQDDKNFDKDTLINTTNSINGYNRADRILYEFDGYNLVFGFDIVIPFPAQRYNLSIKQPSPLSSSSSSVTSEQQRQLEPLPTFGRSANDDSTLSILIANTKHIWPIFVNKFSLTDEKKIDKNPLDKYTKQSVEMAINETLSSFSHNSDVEINDKHTAVDYDVRYTFELEPKKFVAFQQLCQDSGFAYYNRVCFLNVHKEIGPWFGLRAVVTFNIDGPPNIPELFPELKNPYPEGDELLKNKLAEIFGSQNHSYHCRKPITSTTVSATATTTTTTKQDIQKEWHKWVELRDMASEFMSEETLQKYRYSQDQMDYHYTNNIEIIFSKKKKSSSSPKIDI